jgi:hypothetical protein
VLNFSYYMRCGMAQAAANMNAELLAEEAAVSGRCAGSQSSQEVHAVLTAAQLPALAHTMRAGR